MATASSVAGCPDQGSLDRAGADRGGAHVGQPDAGLADGAAIDLHGSGDGHDRPLVGDADELLVVRTPARVLRDPDLGEQLALGDRGLEEVDEEVVGRHGARAAGTGDHELRTERQCGRTEVAGRVGVRQRAAEGAAVPDLGVGQLVLGLGRAARRAP